MREWREPVNIHGMDRIIALTRAVSPSIIHCELTHLARAPIDPIVATQQHDAYERCLEQLGCVIERVEPAPHLPDAVFIEDTALVLPEIAVALRPGAASRRAETAAVGDVMAKYRRVVELPGPHRGGALPTIDGGDVLVIGHTLYVGGSLRSNDAGRTALLKVVEEFGYDVIRVEMNGCLHLKTAATAIADDAILVNPAWVDPRSFDVPNVIEVDPSEPFAANVLRVGALLVHDAAHIRTAARLRGAGYTVVPVDASELAKAEGAVTCCSILIPLS
jgi:dimethylargininase